MRCPCCNQALSDLVYEGVSIHTCDGCGGEFIGSVEMAHIINTRDEQFPQKMQDRLSQREPAFGVPAEQADRKINCPSCANPMQVVNYSGDTGVIVDKCTGCGGVWLDHEELEKVQVLMERWKDEAPEKLQGAADELESARQQAANAGNNAFKGSRFSFVNALMNRLLDAA